MTLKYHFRDRSIFTRSWGPRNCVASAGAAVPQPALGTMTDVGRCRLGRLTTCDDGVERSVQGSLQPVSPASSPHEGDGDRDGEQADSPIRSTISSASPNFSTTTSRY